MSTKLSFDYARMLIRVARAEDGVDVTTLMHTFRQTPAVVAHFTRQLSGAGLLTIENSRLRATKEGREAAAQLLAERVEKGSKKPRAVPDGRTKHALGTYTPYLPRRSEVDIAVFDQAGLGIGEDANCK